ncbi:hypothetical protein Pint_27492 [Pistacia integerrima]|uniref:Uncharacterized protein n=1 Tax=Pistacia integerrima TaxID=434235 RepID=A0ACC0YSD5_9ROSI|nr:hypothetical protein Pint_27492 [Pistacia integerrima]
MASCNGERKEMATVRERRWRVATVRERRSEMATALHDVDCLKMEDEEKVEIEGTVFASTFVEPSFPLQEKVSTEETEAKTEVRLESLPPPRRGQRIYEIDPTLTGFCQHLDYRYGQCKKMREDIDRYEGGLELFSHGYEKLGFTHSATGITYREWAPGAKLAALIGDFKNWNPNADIMTRVCYLCFCKSEF